MDREWTAIKQPLAISWLLTPFPRREKREPLFRGRPSKHLQTRVLRRCRAPRAIGARCEIANSPSHSRPARAAPASCTVSDGTVKARSSAEEVLTTSLNPLIGRLAKCAVITVYSIRAARDRAGRTG